MNINEAFLAFSLGKIKLREPINVRIDEKLIETTVGRLMFNERLPKDFGFINEPLKLRELKELLQPQLKNIARKKLK